MVGIDIIRRVIVESEKKVESVQRDIESVRRDLDELRYLLALARNDLVALERKEADGNVSDVRSEDELGTDAGREEDPAGRDRGTGERGGSLPGDRVRRSADGGTDRRGVSEPGVGGSPGDLPAGQSVESPVVRSGHRKFIRNAAYQITAGREGGRIGLFKGFQMFNTREHAVLQMDDGSVLHPRPEDLELLDA